MTRRILCVMIAMLLILGTPIQALAATHDAADFAGVQNAFATDTDAEVVVNLTQDIAWESQVTAGEGQSYTVNGNGNAVSGVVQVAGAGEVTVKADVEGGVIASDSIELTVNGDVAGDVEANNGADVTINGDIEGDSTMNGMVYANNGEITVNGDVTGWGISANSDSTVTITGNVDSFAGVYADNSTVEVGGSVDAMMPAIQAYNNSTVNVGGDAVSDDMPIMAFDSTVTVGGNVEGGTMDWGTGSASNGCIWAHDSEILVEGNVTASDAGSAPGTCQAAITVVGSSDVTVYGDVTGGDATGEDSIGGDAICVMENLYNGTTVPFTGSVKVAGIVTAGKGEAQDGQVGEYIKIEKPAPSPAPAAPVVKEEAPVEISIIGTAGDEKAEVAVTITVAEDQKEIVIEEMKDEQIEALIETLKETIKEDSEGAVTIDVSVYKGVSSIKIPVKALKSIIETFGKLEIVFNGGIIVIDAQMLEELIDELGFFTINLA